MSLSQLQSLEPFTYSLHVDTVHGVVDTCSGETKMVMLSFPLTKMVFLIYYMLLRFFFNWLSTA